MLKHFCRSEKNVIQLNNKKRKAILPFRTFIGSHFSRLESASSSSREIIHKISEMKKNAVVDHCLKTIKRTDARNVHEMNLVLACSAALLDIHAISVYTEQKNVYYFRYKKSFGQSIKEKQGVGKSERKIGK